MKILKELRLEKGDRQTDIAKYLNITVSAYGNYELGQRSPTPDILSKLADYFNVSVDYLLGRTDKRGFSPSEQQFGISETKKENVTPLEDDLLYEFRELGKKKGLPFQKTVIAYIKQLQDIQ